MYMYMYTLKALQWWRGGGGGGGNGHTVT